MTNYGVSRVVARNEEHGPYVLLRACVVHNYGCACTRLGKKAGPCNCGGAEIWDSVKGRMTEVVMYGGLLGIEE